MIYKANRAMALLSPSSPVWVRALVFFLGCMTVRIGFAVAAALVDPRSVWLPLMGIAALLGGAGLLNAYLKRGATAPGAVFGTPAWWNGLRPVHAAMYFAFAALALARVRLAWVVLAADAAIGAAAFIGHYSRSR
jgi:hypothetical protein